jgi:hypothetical protein
MLISSNKAVSRIKFTITTIPCRQLCLLSFLTAKAIADNAFESGHKSADKVLYGDMSEYTVDSVPIKWKPQVLDECIIPINYRMYLNLWTQTFMVSGVRDDEMMRPYALRVGAGSRLDGTSIQVIFSCCYHRINPSASNLTSSLRNYILHHSIEVFGKLSTETYPKKSLAAIAFPGLAGGNETEAICRFTGGNH